MKDLKMNKTVMPQGRTFLGSSDGPGTKITSTRIKLFQ